MAQQGKCQGCYSRRSSWLMNFDAIAKRVEDNKSFPWRGRDIFNPKPGSPQLGFEILDH
jgi:hypothetical protein